MNFNKYSKGGARLRTKEMGHYEIKNLSCHGWREFSWKGGMSTVTLLFIMSLGLGQSPFFFYLHRLYPVSLYKSDLDLQFWKGE